MSNLTKYLVVVGIMIAIGAMLLIYGSQTITGDLVIEEGKINSLTQLEIKAELDPDDQYTRSVCSSDHRRKRI